MIKDLHDYIVIDVGANLGIFSEVCLDAGFKVLALEPNPYCQPYLAKLKQKFGIEFDYIMAGASDKHGVSSFWHYMDYKNGSHESSISASIHPDKINTESHNKSFEIFIPTIRIVDILSLISKELKVILKIDIEGIEEFIIPDLISCAENINFVFMTPHFNKILNESYGLAIADFQSWIKRNGLENKWFIKGILDFV